MSGQDVLELWRVVGVSGHEQLPPRLQGSASFSSSAPSMAQLGLSLALFDFPQRLPHLKGVSELTDFPGDVWGLAAVTPGDSPA